MRSKISVLIAVLAIFNLCQAQQLSVVNKRPVAVAKTAITPVINNVKPDRCGYALQMEKAKAKGFSNEAFEAGLSALIQKRLASRPSFTGPITIPVIFHVLYRTANALGTSSPNLVTSKYQSQIAQLNKDYSNLSGSAYGVAADVQLRFCMAIVDTAGRPLAEAGIDRINAQTRGFSNTNNMTADALQTYFDGTIKPATIWDPNSYLNIWTAAMNSSQLLGYASFPALSTLGGLDNTETNSTAGAVINWQSIGSVTDPGADASYGYGRTITHELGHFFGLRHIWGDETCGNDYCADTPPQSAETSGCPATGTLNGCTPSGPKMFENYMDYSNDACLNTFTLNQAQRSQTVMDNSPRRKEFVNSKACVARAGNTIVFNTATPLSTSETGTTAACPSSRSYTFTVSPSVSATGTATVTFNVLGGTAVLNKDYSFSPASVSFTNGDAASKTLTVTVYDNQAIDGNKTLQIGYTITGTGVTAGPDKQSISINIIDDDYNMPVNNTTPAVPLLSENFDASTNIPATWINENYSDGSPNPNVWVVSTNGGAGTTNNAAHITNNVTTKANAYTKTTASDSYLITPLIDASGLKNINVSFKWRCVGEADYDLGYIGYIPEGQTPTAENVLFFNTTFGSQSTIQTANLAFPASFNNTKFYLVLNWYNDEIDGANPGFTVDDVLVTGNALSVATTADADTTFTQSIGQSVTYYSATGTNNRVLAKIDNLNQNLNCVTATLPFVGAGQTAITTSAGSYQRSNKVIKLTPATVNTTASYQATFYFTTAELAGWADPLGVKILKVKDGVSLAGTLTNADATIITPTVEDQRATKGYIAYTGNFTDGFSQFMLVSSNIALPVNLLSFNANVAGKSIALKWVTSQEVNNKGFVLERSTDAVNFNKITWIDGKVNSNVATTYNYTDNFVQAGITYYYRLRQTDLDGKEKLSGIRQAKIDKQVISVTLTPNPAKNRVNVFVTGTNSPADIYIINTQGQVLRSFKQVNSTTAAPLNISGLPAGMYIVNIALPNETRREKLIIQ